MANKEWKHETTTVYYPYEIGCSSETCNAIICPVCNEHYLLIEAMFFTHKKGLKHCPNCGEPLDKFFTDDRANGKLAGVHKYYVEVPCNVGDEVYWVDRDNLRICKCRVASIRMYEKTGIALLDKTLVGEFGTANVHIQFNNARESAEKSTLINLVKEERALTQRLYRLAAKDARVGYEASNHYYYTHNNFLEKFINIEFLLSEYGEK